MRKISIKKIRYDELQVLKKYFEIGIIVTKANFSDPDRSTVFALIAELYVKITRKILFVDKSKLHTLSLSTAEALAIIAYTNYINISNDHSLATIVSFKQTITKQLL